MIDEVSLLGQQLGKSINNQSTIAQNITADEDETQLQVPINLKIKETGQIVMNSLTYATDSFILGHPVQGYLGGFYNITRDIPSVVHYFTLDETTGTTISSAISTATGTVSSSVILGGTGKINTGLNFNGLNVCTTNIAMTDIKAVSFWGTPPFAVSNENESTTVNRYNIYSSDDGGYLRLNSNFRDGNGGSGNYKYWGVTTSLTYSTSSFYHIVHYIDNINLAPTVYANNSKSIMTSVSSSGTISSFGGYLTFGRYDINGTHYLPIGKIDEVAVFTSDITDSIVSSLYCASVAYPVELTGYKLGGGYLQVGGTPSFPAAFPFTFASPSNGKTTLYTYSY